MRGGKVGIFVPLGSLYSGRRGGATGNVVGGVP